MSDRHLERPVVRRAVFALTPDRRRQALEVLWYIEHRHHWIDPDMYDIDLDDVAALQRMFGADDEDGPATISMTFEDVVALETCVMAADTYTHRPGERTLCPLTDEEFADIDRWTSEARQCFVTRLDAGADG